MKKPRIYVFVVDDDFSFRKSLQRMLQSRGMSVCCFESASAFLDSVPSGQKGIAIVDIHLPLFDGFSLMDSMKKMGYGMPVIVVTGKTEANTRDLAMEGGAVGFLQKPFLANSLMTLIEELQNQEA